MPDPSHADPNVVGTALVLVLALGAAAGHAFAAFRPLRLTVAGALVVAGGWTMVDVLMRSTAPDARVTDLALIAPILSLGLGAVICAVDRVRMPASPPPLPARVRP